MKEEQEIVRTVIQVIEKFSSKTRVFRDILFRRMNKNTIQRARYRSRCNMYVRIIYPRDYLSYVSFRSQPFVKGRGRSSVEISTLIIVADLRRGN